MVPRPRRGFRDGVVVGVEAVREEAFFQVEPDALDWIEFRGVRHACPVEILWTRCMALIQL